MAARLGRPAAPSELHVDASNVEPEPEHGRAHSVFSTSFLVRQPSSANTDQCIAWKQEGSSQPIGFLFLFVVVRSQGDPCGGAHEHHGRLMSKDDVRELVRNTAVYAGKGRLSTGVTLASLLLYRRAQARDCSR